MAAWSNRKRIDAARMPLQSTRRSTLGTVCSQMGSLARGCRSQRNVALAGAANWSKFSGDTGRIGPILAEADSLLRAGANGFQARADAAAQSVAVLIPCRNEAAAIERVVHDFQRAIPGSIVHVYDNNSNDATAAVAMAAGAVVGTERLQGKGQVVRRMFADVEADIYVLVDGDGTYDPEVAGRMVAMLTAGQLDMVTAVRVSEAAGAYRRGHRLGNALLTSIVGASSGGRCGICCPATGCSRGGSSNRFRPFRGA